MCYDRLSSVTVLLQESKVSMIKLLALPGSLLMALGVFLLNMTQLTHEIGQEEIMKYF